MLTLGCLAVSAADEYERGVLGQDFESFVEDNQAVLGLKMTLAAGFDNSMLRVDEHTKAAREKYHHMTHLINKKKAREVAAQQAAGGVNPSDTSG